jgi:small subunit ribosomal protein S8
MDKIAEFATRIRNASHARHEKVDIPASRVRQGIAEVLKEEGLIRNFKVVRDGKQGVMRVYLKYSESGDPLISDIQKVSRSGRRAYVAVDKIPKVRSGFGITVLSTNVGILSGRVAQEKKIGGELLLKVW